MARTKGSKNKVKNETVLSDNANISNAKKEKGAALKEYWANKKAQAQKVTNMVSNENKSKVTEKTQDNSSATVSEKSENSALTMIKKILRSNNPQKCYLVIEF